MRYLVKVSYMGAAYHGFQRQPNARSVEEELEKAFSKVYRESIDITGSSRTDAGVHAMGNSFHVDLTDADFPRKLYNLNALLPIDIAITEIYEVKADFHARFDASERHYIYSIHRTKSPLIQDRSYYYPYTLDWKLLEFCAEYFMSHSDFCAFAKSNSQVNHFKCQITESKWLKKDNEWRYHVRGNRFLRGMVRALVATQLQVARGFMSISDFQQLILNPQPHAANFSSPAHGLMLVNVDYPAKDLLKRIV